jgi:hypothetical protein
MWRALALGLASCAVSVSAQVPSPGAAASAEAHGCEFHIWPSAGIESVSEGGLLNQTRNALLRDKEGKPTPLADALDPNVQLDVISTMELPIAFNFGPARVIAHAEALPPTPTGAPIVRHTTSTEPCYAEMIIRRVVYTQNLFAGAGLQGFFSFREFGEGNTLKRSFSSMADTPIPIFPAKPAVDQNDRLIVRDALVRLRTALRADILIFAGYARQSPFQQHGVHH